MNFSDLLSLPATNILTSSTEVQAKRALRPTRLLRKIKDDRDSGVLRL